jgi:hypothetical protein
VFDGTVFQHQLKDRHMKNLRAAGVQPTMTLLAGLTLAFAISDPLPVSAAGRDRVSSPVRTHRCANVKAFYANYPRPAGYARSGRPLVPGTSRAGMQKNWTLQLAMAAAPICK